jgi:hypothetical protein
MTMAAIAAMVAMMPAVATNSVTVKPEADPHR